MDVLVVAPSLPFPPNQGQRLRTWNLVSRLARRHRVTLVTWIPAGTPDEHVQAVGRAVDELHVELLRPFRQDLRTRVRRHLRFFATGMPTYVQAMIEARGLLPGGAGRPFLERALSPGSFDVVVLEEESLAWFPLPTFEEPVVVHRLNVFERAVGDVPIEHPLRRLAKPLEMRAWRRFDAGVDSRADLVVPPTPEAATTLRATSPGTAVTVVTNGVDVAPLPTPPSQGTDVAFIGWMGYPPNVDAVRWFVREVWPAVRRVAPDCRLRVIGREPSAAVEALAGDGVVVTGEVPDVVEACRGVRAAVVPLRGGMGIKNKTLESMGMGLPVVSTGVGAEGIAARAVEGLLVHDDPRAFAEAVIGLLRDPARADALGAAAHRFVGRHFRWDEIAAGYEDALRRAVSRGGRSHTVR